MRWRRARTPRSSRRARRRRRTERRSRRATSCAAGSTPTRPRPRSLRLLEDPGARRAARAQPTACCTPRRPTSAQAGRARRAATRRRSVARGRRPPRCSDELRAAGLHRHDRRRLLRRLRDGARPVDPASSSRRSAASRRVDAARPRPGPHRSAAAGASTETRRPPGPTTRRAARLGRGPGRGARRARTATRRTAVIEDPQVPESRRFCARCGEPVGRGARRRAGRTEGFCRKCGAPFSFAPKLARRRRRRRPVRGRRLPRARRHGLDLPRPGPQRLRPLGGAQGPAQHRRRRRDGRRARRAALPRRGRAPEHRQDLQLRPARAARATSSWSTSAARA